MQNNFTLFLPCALGVQDILAQEVYDILKNSADKSTPIYVHRAGVSLQGDWQDMMRLNLRSRVAQRVLVQLANCPYQTENDLYTLAHDIDWDNWFDVNKTFKVSLSAQASPLKSLNFATLKVKDGIVDKFRSQHNRRPSIDTHRPQVQIFVHLTAETATLSIDTSGEPLFKRGWRDNKGAAPLKETLAAAMVYASGWLQTPNDTNATPVPLYDPCCGSGTIVIEAAQMALQIPPGLQRQFAFEHLKQHQAQSWLQIKQKAHLQILDIEQAKDLAIYASDVTFRMVDFAQRNAQFAKVENVIKFKTGDALALMPPCENAGVLLLNPPYGERLDAIGSVKATQGKSRSQSAPIGREYSQNESGQGLEDFFPRLATHWKQNFSGWNAFVLSPDMKLPSKMRLKESRRQEMFNGAIECRLFRFDMIKGSFK